MQQFDILERILRMKATESERGGRDLDLDLDLVYSELAMKLVPQN